MHCPCCSKKLTLLFVRVITIGDDERLVGHAKGLVNELRAAEVRATGDYSSDPIKAKIAGR